MFKIIVVSVFVIATAEKISYENSLVRMIEDAGHAVEVHRVHTEDKYILTIFRIPSKQQNPKIALFMHGFASSAADFVIGGNGASLAYLIADNGYDVWLGNSRGNIFSQNHQILQNTSIDFWDFSFHEIGMYDLPAIIDYVLHKVNGTSLTYLGYSQGTTALFVLLSMKPEYNSKISTAHLMAPVAYMRYPSFVKNSIPIVYRIVDFLHFIQIYDLVFFHTTIRQLLAFSCSKHSIIKFICKYKYMLWGGYSSQYDENLAPKIFQFSPSSAGYKQLLHYTQIAEHNGTFVQFDHLRDKNMKIYNQPQPPPYNISNVKTKIHFLFGANDSQTNMKDVHYLMAKLKTSTISITKLYNWNHLDFMYGKEVQEKVNSVIYKKMMSFA